VAGKPAPGRGAGGKPPAGKPGKSIVNQRQTPWGLIITATLVVAFAVAIVGYAVTRPGKADAWSQPELKAAKQISGVTYKKEPKHTHVTSGTVKYDATPPVGGDHSYYWADCTGTVYPNAIANENAVHDLEHGAVWIAYQPGLSKADQATLAKFVTGQDHMLMSPYPGLTSKVSLQSWGYQLKLDSVTDSRIQTFIDTVRANSKTTPEYGGDCSQPTFKTKPSTFGKPLYAPAT
jgi:hypothetical protein